LANVTYHIEIDDPLDFYYSNATEVTNSSETEATYVDNNNFNSITLYGTKLKFEQGDLVSGTVTKVVFKDAEGLAMATVKGEYTNFDKIDDAIGTPLFDELLFSGNDKFAGSVAGDTLLGHKGNDRLAGRGGEDEIWGGRGDDRMTGGGGSDTFYFFVKSLDYKGDGHDVITDFDAIGIDGEQDYLGCPKPLSIKKSGHDAVLTFEGGNTLTLLDVKPSQITDADFVIAS